MFTIAADMRQSTVFEALFCAMDVAVARKIFSDKYLVLAPDTSRPYLVETNGRASEWPFDRSQRFTSVILLDRSLQRRLHSFSASLLLLACCAGSDLYPDRDSASRPSSF
jgi:hypothetical protein